MRLFHILKMSQKGAALTASSVLTKDPALKDHLTVEEDGLGKFTERRHAPWSASLPIPAQSVRLAARLNATRITEKEHSSLIQERANLLNKRFSDGLTKGEETRLEYVRWSLDRIEDAKHGSALDSLEGAVMRYQEALKELQDLQVTLRSKLK